MQLVSSKIREKSNQRENNIQNVVIILTGWMLSMAVIGSRFYPSTKNKRRTAALFFFFLFLKYYSPVSVLDAIEDSSECVHPIKQDKTI